MGSKSFYFTDIEELLDAELERASKRFDIAMESDILSENTIKRASAERITINRIKSLLKSEMES